MAFASKSSLLASLRGALGEIVIRHTPQGIVVSMRPVRRKRKLPKQQQKTCDRFKDAVKHAKKVLAEFKRMHPGAKAVIKGKSIFRTAIAEYLRRD
jgi:hypothetical protein